MFAGLLVACVTAGASSTSAATSAATSPAPSSRRAVQYALEIPAPASQWIHVTMTVTRPRGLRTRVAMPAWTPGSYLVRDHARHVDDLRAEDLRGRPLAVERLDKQTWRVDHGLGGFRVRYRVFAAEPGVRTNFVDDRHGTLNGAGLFLYLIGETGRPADLALTLPRGWQAHTALAAAASGPLRFTAPDYDGLIDAPIALGTPEVRGFTVGRTRVELVFSAPAGSNADTARIAADLEKVVAAFARLMGGLPLDRYVFLVLADETGDGGLEHAGSTLMRVPRDMFGEPGGYRKLTNLAAHEFFHVWNVKRIRDAALTPYDYSQENYSSLLWFHEGFTETMEQTALLRAGIVGGDEWLRELAAAWTAYVRRPGRNHAALADLSFDAWTKAYKPSPSHGNTLVSYYEKGYLLGVCLDLELRLRSARHGQSGSLAGLFRRLMASHGARGRGITREDILAAAEAEAGESLTEFFVRHVDGTAELPLPELLPQIGVTVTSSARTPPRAYSGLALEPDRTIKNIEPGSPAEAAGLMLGDEVVAVADLRVTTGAQALARLGERRVGDKLEVAVFRAGRLVRASLTLAADPHRTYSFEPTADAALPPQTLGLRRAWLARDPR
ncbi:MAG: M61 family metallopeptidase [Myxococcales bacterium]|nr:M61 family metallopeptidase [Myxococcales bacterium]